VPINRGYDDDDDDDYYYYYYYYYYYTAFMCHDRVLASESRRKGSDAPSLFGSLSG